MDIRCCSISICQSECRIRVLRLYCGYTEVAGKMGVKRKPEPPSSEKRVTPFSVSTIALQMSHNGPLK